MPPPGKKKRKAKSDRGPAKRARNERIRRGADDEDDAADAAADAHAVDTDVREVRAAVEAAQAAAEAQVETAGDATGAPELSVDSDPYLLADATYIEKDLRWRNKQRTLVFCSRGVTSRFRHLMEDLRKMLPHHKTEPKFEQKDSLRVINEVCELKSCNNAVFFEARKKQDLYLWLARVPAGPTLKFQVLNIHTSGEVRLAGNCLLGSRPLLVFDHHFDNISFLKLMKEMFVQALGTPRNHPKCKPFHDHVLCFYYMDRKIWFRHYQIAPETPDDSNDPEKQALTEIGPRFVLDPIRIMGGSFGGPTLYQNPFYMSPTALRVEARKALSGKYVKRLRDKADREEREKDAELPKDELDEVFE